MPPPVSDYSITALHATTRAAGGLAANAPSGRRRGVRWRRSRHQRGQGPGRPPPAGSARCPGRAGCRRTAPRRSGPDGRSCWPSTLRPMSFASMTTTPASARRVRQAAAASAARTPSVSSAATLSGCAGAELRRHVRREHRVLGRPVDRAHRVPGDLVEQAPLADELARGAHPAGEQDPRQPGLADRQLHRPRAAQADAVRRPHDELAQRPRPPRRLDVPDEVRAALRDGDDLLAHQQVPGRARRTRAYRSSALAAPTRSRTYP